MRLLKGALLLLVLALPLVADDKPPIGGVEPDTGGGGCVECYRLVDSIYCGGEPSGAGWTNCEGGWLWLCDGYAGCTRVPNCGQRCAIA
jgi:hypothetical protein